MSTNSDYHPLALVWLRRAVQTINANYRNVEEWWIERQLLVEDWRDCNGNSWEIVAMCQARVERINRECNKMR